MEVLPHKALPSDVRTIFQHSLWLHGVSDWLFCKVFVTWEGLTALLLIDGEQIIKDCKNINRGNTNGSQTRSEHEQLGLWPSFHTKTIIKIHLDIL